MGLFSKVREAISISVGSTYDSAMTSSLRYPALENSAFWACVTQLSRTFATLPLHVYRDTGKATVDDRSSDLAVLLKNPCPYMTPYVWRFIMAFNIEMRGEAMAIIERKGKKVVALLPVSPNMMQADWEGNRLIYRYNGTTRVPAENVLVISALPVGISGVLSPVDYATRDIEVAKNSQRLQDNFFKQGTTLGGVLTVPRGTSKEIKTSLMNLLKGEYSGSANAYKTMVIEDSMKYEPIRLSERDTNTMVEAQKWTATEVARRFGVPASFIGDRTSGGTYANIEQELLTLVSYSLQPRAIAWEEALGTLCEPDQYVKINLKGLLRGDHATRSAWYHNAIMDGWMSINEVRHLEDMNPIKGGDEHFFPSNYTKLADVGKNFGGFPGYGEKKEKLDPIEEKKLVEKRYVEGVLKEARSTRKKIETVMRKQLRQELDEFKRLYNGNQGDVAIAFRSFVQEHADDWGAEYAPIYLDMIRELLPSVRKIAKVDDVVDEGGMAAFADKLAQGVAARFGLNRANEAEKAILDGEDMDSLYSRWAEKPSEESHEESQRAVNAGSLFCMTQLHIEFMHVSAQADACEFCSQLDGKVVEVNGVVLDKGTEVTDGYGNVRVIQKNYKHPPWHTHCECIVVPGR